MRWSQILMHQVREHRLVLSVPVPVPALAAGFQVFRDPKASVLTVSVLTTVCRPQWIRRAGRVRNIIRHHFRVSAGS